LFGDDVLQHLCERAAERPAPRYPEDDRSTQRPQPGLGAQLTVTRAVEHRARALKSEYFSFFISSARQDTSRRRRADVTDFYEPAAFFPVTMKSAAAAARKKLELDYYTQMETKYGQLVAANRELQATIDKLENVIKSIPPPKKANKE
jgi:hypothetical protein